ncbi:hypothetical protein ACJJTC_006320 [Scirpophaga incertulas]
MQSLVFYLKKDSQKISLVLDQLVSIARRESVAIKNHTFWPAASYLGSDLIETKHLRPKAVGCAWRIRKLLRDDPDLLEQSRAHIFDSKIGQWEPSFGGTDFFRPFAVCIYVPYVKNSK